MTLMLIILRILPTLYILRNVRENRMVPDFFRMKGLGSNGLASDVTQPVEGGSLGELHSLRGEAERTRK